MSMKTIILIDGLILAVAGALQAGLSDPTLGLNVAPDIRGWIGLVLLLITVAAKYIEANVEVK